MHMLSRDDVQKLADLSLIDVPDAELDTLAGEIDAILGYVSEITSLVGDEQHDTTPAQYNVMRDDEITVVPDTYTDRILAEAPDRTGAYVRVKKIL